MTDLVIKDTPVLDATSVRAYICPLADDKEIVFFLELCKRNNLNPFLKEAYLIKYSKDKPAQMVTGKDVFLKRAEINPKYQGFSAGIIAEKNGELTHRVGTLVKSGESLVGGWAEVYKKDFQPFRCEISRAEFDKKQSNWVTMPATMCRKVALVSALREAFPSDFQGMYDESEMGAIDANAKTVQRATAFFEEPKQEAKAESGDLQVFRDTIDGFTLEQFKTDAPAFFAEIKDKLPEEAFIDLRSYGVERMKKLQAEQSDEQTSLPTE